MARIPEELIERIKTEISLARLLESQGYPLQKAGKDYLTRCPFHDDATASLVVTPAKNLFHCFGCDAGGTVIDWVMRTQGVSFRHAVELLQNEASVPGSGSGTSLAAKEDVPVKRSRKPKLEAPFERSEDEQTLLNRVVDYYHKELSQHPDALAYCEKRGLSREAVEHFKLGFANRTLGYRLPPKTVKAGEAIRSQLQTLGILRDSGHEHFNGSVVVPVFDEHGNVTELYGRKIGERLRKGTPLHLYLPGPHRGIFNRAAFMSMDGRYTGAPGGSAPVSANKEIILCESIIDALTFWSHGFYHVTCSYGVHGFTDELFEAFKQHAIERVLIAYDRDAAGNQAAEALAEQLNAEGIDCYRVLFPKGMDANSYALTMQPAAKSLELVLRKAEWMGKGQKSESANQKPTARDGGSADHARSDYLPEENNTGEQPPSQAKAHFEKQLKEVSEQMKAVNTAEPLPASPMPEHKPVDVDAQVDEHEIHLSFENRHYRVRGLDKNPRYEQLKINLLARCADQLHVDTLDLYNAKHRAGFIQQAGIELGVHHETVKADLGKVLLKLEQLQDEQIKQAREADCQPVTLSNEDQQAALDLLQSPDLLNRIVADIRACGLVGEDTNALVSYLACVSRQLDGPLAVLIQSTSAAGKSSLMDAVLALMPEEARVQYSAMTGQSLFYLGETDLKHKILAIAEEEGAQQASYALKLLQSEGELTIASTGKDEATGNLVTRQYRVEGPVMLFLTTTAIDIDEELMNRCTVLTVNESREQTRAIHALQRQKRTLDGLKQKQRKQAVLNVHRNAQRLLRPLHVLNPYADRLTFTDTQTRTRRDHEKYLTLIDSIALLHQHQRDIKTLPAADDGSDGGEPLEYVEVTLQDIEIANTLAHETLGRTLDELPPQTRTLLKHITHMVNERCRAEGLQQSDYRFSRKDVRVYTGWSDGQLKIHCRRLEELEYLLVHRGRRGKSIEYELLYDGNPDEDRARLAGLIDVQALKHDYDAQKSGDKRQKTGPSQAQVSPKSGWGQGRKKAEKANGDNRLTEYQLDYVDNAYQAVNPSAS